MWESRQGAAFVALVTEIEGCSSLEELAVVGKHLYARALPHEQAGVAWSHFQLRKRALEAAVTLGAPARALVAQVESASPHALAGLGARLYRLQHTGGARQRCQRSSGGAWGRRITRGARHASRRRARRAHSRSAPRPSACTLRGTP